MKYIYLDIDGVMNSNHGSSNMEKQISDMEIIKLILLKEIMDSYGFDGVIITSDRRLSKIDLANKIDAFKKFNINVCDVIRDPHDVEINDNRGKQIYDHYKLNKQFISGFVILDDNDYGISDYFKNEFIKVNAYYGLNDTIKEKIKLCYKRKLKN